MYFEANAALRIPDQLLLHMSLKTNVIANYLGQGWQLVMGVAFIPLYIRYLGIEAYGLIGMFAILQACLGLLDMGMRPALGREMARFTGGVHNAQSIRDLLRSVEIIGIIIAWVVMLGIHSASGWLASDWLAAKNLPVEAVAQAFAAMGAVTALSFIESIYVSSIAGLQRQVQQNLITCIMATVRGLGAVGVLAWISPTIEAFFIWQGVTSLTNIALFSSVIYRTLPPAPQPARFSWSALRGIRQFATGMITITLLALLLTQSDKILLSRLLTLESFAHYTLAGTVANALRTLSGPISTAFYPRFTELATRGDESTLRSAYHQGAQLVTVLMGSAAAVLMLFSEQVLLLWTADSALAHQVAPVMAVLALGTLLNGLMGIPYQMQLAHGWTTLMIKFSIVIVAILIPSLVWVAPKYGMIGAAWAWVTLNAGYLAFSIYFMHRRLLPTEKWRWYHQDIFIPLTFAIATAGLLRWLMPEDLGWTIVAEAAVHYGCAVPDVFGRLFEFAALLLISGCVLLVTALSASVVRHQLTLHVPVWKKLIIPNMAWTHDTTH